MAEFTVTATVLNQNGRELYCFGMNSATLKRLCYVTPRTKDTPEEVQRILDPRRAKEIGDYIRQENSLLPNSLVVSLTEDVDIGTTGDPATRAIRFPNTDGKFAYVLDGQHRLEGFKHSDGLEFDLPVVAIYNADDGLRGKIFADINSKQQRVSDVHLLSLYYQIRELPVDETPVMDVVNRLHTDTDSPLRGKIQMLDNDKGTWVKNIGLKKLLAPHLMSGGVIARKTPAEQAKILKEYFRAVSRVWPEAWGDVKKYNLNKPIGFELITGVFPAVKHRVDLNEGRQYVSKAFETQLAPLKTAAIEFPGVGGIELNWLRGPMGFLSNRATRTIMVRQLSDTLRAADEAA